MPVNATGQPCYIVLHRPTSPYIALHTALIVCLIMTKSPWIYFKTALIYHLQIVPQIKCQAIVFIPSNATRTLNFAAL